MSARKKRPTPHRPSALRGPVAGLPFDDETQPYNPDPDDEEAEGWFETDEDINGDR